MLYIYNTNQRQLFLNHKIILILKMELVVGTCRQELFVEGNFPISKCGLAIVDQDDHLMFDT